jgi:Protein of unknown function (DUF2442)
MSISASSVSFYADTFAVALSDGRVLHIPLVWFPRLLNATTEQRLAYELSASGIHWDAIDEDISVEGLLAGRGDIMATKRVAA